MNRVHTFLEMALKQGGSDLHLVSGEVPRIRINGVLEPVRFRELTREDMERLLAEVLTEGQRARLARDLSVDFAYTVPELGRFRVNAYHHARGLAAALRVVPDSLPLLDDLGLPTQVRELVRQPKGLTLVTGPTGSGKSTTLASIVDHLNRTRRGHIITIEDPIEFVHQYRSSVVTQREIGAHAASFAEALRDAVREDPDAILVGELRDIETISLALTAAETGIQVLGTLHTNGAGRCVDRIINVFPARRQDQVRSMLADSLRMVVSQQLVRLADGSARKLVADVLVNTAAMASMIRSGNTHKLATIMQSGGRQGMQLLDNVLHEMLRAEAITGEEAWEHAVDKAPFERHLGLDGAA
ncbi:MAG TPA: PilT/PilU family type 4a pilus ATPase [Candidatus Eisenbacteria bacterium]